jgi:hypothetical protein
VKERFVLTKAVAAWHPMQRVPGQVPTKEAIALLKFASKPAPKFNPAVLLKQDAAYLTPTSVVSGLGLEYGQEASWVKFLEASLRADNELLLRKAIIARAQGENMDPVQRRVVLERALSAYRDMRKSMIEVTTPDELLKGDPKGGRYVRRALAKDGKRYQYFYDEEQYKKWKGAHITGEEGSHTAIRNGVQKAIQNGGTNGCDLKCLQPLVKRYGHKMVASVLDEDVKKKKNLCFKKGRLYAADKGASNAPERRSKR